MDLLLAPERYVQRKGLLNEAGRFIFPFGKKPLVLADRRVFSIIGEKIICSLREVGLSPTFEEFRGECSPKEIERVVKVAQREEIDVIVGCGGGKALDTAKTTSFYLRLPVVTVPTSAATCAAWSFIAPLYTESGAYIRTMDLKKSPELVLADSEIIARAPVRLLCAGMADTLAKWYEGRVAAKRMKKDLCVKLALDLSRRAYEIIKESGPKAKEDAERGNCSDEVELIIQTNILLTGLIAGLGRKIRSLAAHALNYAMSFVEGTRSILHGEKVAFGIIMQLILENREDEEIEELLNLYSLLDLPLSLEEIGLKNEEKLRKTVKTIFREKSHIYDLPFPVNEEMVYRALLRADEWGRKVKSRKENIPCLTRENCQKRKEVF
ncbi:glycerol dehydrogenase [Candidatus Aerophobetes bacterium]|uniref:Glycerol dehydrogenase n=1 Tax=Aerophobetes bacterium TaxID=2030807 RepID=A0A497E5W7_UNCAE|nr:MAG: glycerol dehydrogenase [Candidatus Aerophobetes bacterium]